MPASNLVLEEMARHAEMAARCTMAIECESHPERRRKFEQQRDWSLNIISQIAEYRHA